MFANIGCNDPINPGDRQVALLTEFYTAYSKLWAMKPFPHPGKLYLRLDSLQKKFCTQQLRKEAKEWFDEGHDLLTNDWGIDIESLDDMKIKKDTTKEKTYILSYVANTFPVSPYAVVIHKYKYNAAEWGWKPTFWKFN